MHKNNDLAKLILRLVFGGFMLYGHGWGKLMKLINGFSNDSPIKFADPIGLGAPFSLALTSFAEAICAAFLVVGYFTRWAAVPLIITMLVAAFVIHGADPFAKQEKALMYLAGYLAIFFAGPGRHSLDAKLRGL